MESVGQHDFQTFPGDLNVEAELKVKADQGESQSGHGWVGEGELSGEGHTAQPCPSCVTPSPPRECFSGQQRPKMLALDSGTTGPLPDLLSL